MCLCWDLFGRVCISPSCSLLLSPPLPGDQFMLESSQCCAMRPWCSPSPCQGLQDTRVGPGVPSNPWEHPGRGAPSSERDQDTPCPGEPCKSPANLPCGCPEIPAVPAQEMFLRKVPRTPCIPPLPFLTIPTLPSAAPHSKAEGLGEMFHKSGVWWEHEWSSRSGQGTSLGKMGKINQPGEMGEINQPGEIKWER